MNRKLANLRVRVVSVLLVIPSSLCAASQAYSPFAWLEEIYGARALTWVRQQNERTLAHFRALPGFEDDYRLSKAIISSQRSGNRIFGEVGVTEAYGDWVYTFDKEPEHPNGIWRRFKLDPHGVQTDQQTLFDIDAYDRDEGIAWNWEKGPMSRDCEADRCILRFFKAPDAETRMGRFKLVEFDLSKPTVVHDGFDLSGEGTPPDLTWKNEHTLWVSANWGPTSVGAAGFRLDWRLWQRRNSIDSARPMFHLDADGLRFPILDSYQLSRGEKLDFVYTADSVVHSVLRLRDDGSQIRLNWPEGTVVSGVYDDRVILWLMGKAWVSHSHLYRQGSVLAIPIRDIESLNPNVATIWSPESEEAVRSVEVGRNAVLINILKNVSGRLIICKVDGNGWTTSPVPLPDAGTLYPIVTNASSTFALIRFESFFEPPTAYLLSLTNNEVTRIDDPREEFEGIGRTNNADRVEQHFVTSDDGTRVPYFLVYNSALRRRDLNPTLLCGYGALNSPRTPNFDAIRNALWIAHGGVYVLANVRGGGEFGPTWHVMGTNRSHTYDDFVAVAEDLIRTGIASAATLGVIGHSNGGLLVGTALNNHPKLFRAAIIQNGVLDLWLHTHGENTAEYGAWDNAVQLSFLKATSPFQALRPHRPFPSVLVTDSIDDGPAFPQSARRYVARLQSFGEAAYYRELPEGAHSEDGLTADESAEHWAMVYSFLWNELGAHEVH